MLLNVTLRMHGSAKVENKIVEANEKLKIKTPQIQLVNATR